jgi:hypothetical protein
VKLDHESIENADIKKVHSFLIESFEGTKRAKRLSTPKMKALIELVSDRFGIDVPQSVNLKSPFSNSRLKRERIDASFLDSLLRAVPSQPWKPGMHVSVAKQMQCSQRKVSDGIQELIESGVFYTQKDGIVYDDDGKVMCFDETRVDPMDVLEATSDASYQFPHR